MALPLRLLCGALRAQSARNFAPVGAELSPSFLQLDRTSSCALLNHHPERGIRTKGPRGNVPFPNWITPELEHTVMVQERLTEDNAQFLQQVVKDTYVSPLKDPPPERQAWTTRTKRAGLLCKKIGVIPQWTTNGKRILTTMCQVVDNHVVSTSTSEEFAKQFRGDKYKAKAKKVGCMVVGAESIDPTNLTDEYCKLFEASGVQPKRKITKFVVSDNALLQPGTRLRATHFRVGDYVGIGGKTIDYGFQGVMKRWGFKGGPASHGATKFHRRPGSIGFSVHAGRVMKGKKMPGHMGNAWRIQRGFKILRMNTKYDVIYVRGPTPPGLTNSWIYLWDTILPKRKPYTNPPPMPTHYPEDDKEPQPEDMFAPELFQMDQPTIVYEITEEDLKQQRTGAKTALKAAPKTAAKTATAAVAAPKAGKTGGKP